MAKNPGHGEGLKHKIKSFLGLRKGATIPTGLHEDKESEDYTFSPDVLKELSKENNLNHRTRVLRELCEVVSAKKLEEHAVEAVWQEIEDLLQPNIPTEPRQTALRFLTCLASGQFERLGLLRAQFLRLIEHHEVNDDLSHRIELLRVLTDNGKEVSYCEHIGPFLLTFTSQAFVGDRSDDFLQLLINFVHYNSSFLDKEIITGLIERTCEFCNRAKNEKEIESCLQLLDATLRYGGLPSEGLYPIIATLCRTVNIERFCQASWKLMKTLVGTRLGHSTIYVMCHILEDENNLNDSILLRGAVFFIGMCVWGSKRVTSLQHKPISLLPSFKQALHCNHPIVAHEIALSLQRLVKKYGKDLRIVTWDIILDMTEILIKLQQNLSGSNESLKRIVHDLLTNTEELFTAEKFDGTPEKLFAIIEKCSSQRPESSVITLLSYLNNKIHSAKAGWLERLKYIMEKYFRNETRTVVREKVLEILLGCFTSFGLWYEEELLELAVQPYLNNIHLEEDSTVRLVSAQLLVDLIITCSSSKCMDVLTIIEKLINRLSDSTRNSKKTYGPKMNNEDQLRDINVAVSGLVTAFKKKLFESPPLMVVRILEILVEHITNHYVYGFTAHAGSTIRQEILGLSLSIRADDLHRIGVVNQETSEQHSDVRYSVFVTCAARKRLEQTASITTPVHRKLSLTKECPFYKAFDAILNCLKDEWDWTLLEYVLKHLPSQLQNKTLILGGGADVTTLCAFLCKMVNDGMYLNKVKNVPPGAGKSDLHNLVFPILAVLVTYHNAIEKNRQIELVKSLELGLNSQCARQCVICLTICTLEMKSVMLRILPSILLKLSKISATIPMSIPMLEFLSSLKEVRELYSNFVEEQYMSIFAIALPYTDAYRYSEYTVTLAYYVISSWFTRCRLSFRKGFVRLITKGLQSSVSKPSVSQSNGKQNNALKSNKDIKDMQMFHDEMKEVCSDMMAKYSFSTLSNQPKRSPVAEFILSNGLSQSWLVGNTLVTVTTSATSSDDCATCAQKRAKNIAAKAAEKLLLLKQNDEVQLARRQFLLEKDQTTEYGDCKDVEMTEQQVSQQSLRPNDATNEIKDSKEEIKEAPSQGGINVSSYQDNTSESRKETTQQIFIDNPEEVTAVENKERKKGLRADSAVEMTEETESRPHGLQHTSDKSENKSEAISIDQEVSLVNKLALEQQQPGQMFSPSDYLFNNAALMMERGISLTASTELENDQSDDPQASKRPPILIKSISELEKEASGYDIDAQDVQKDLMKDDDDVQARTDGKEINASREMKKQASVESNVNKNDETNAKRNSEDVEQRVDGMDFSKDISQHVPELAVTQLEKQPYGSNGCQSHTVDTTLQYANVDATTKGASVELGTSTLAEQIERTMKTQKLAAMKPSAVLNSNFLQPAPKSSTHSQSSSKHDSPVVSRKTSLQASLQTSIELSSDYEIVNEDTGGQLQSAGKLDQGKSQSTNMETSFPLCNCSCQGWAEVLLRRPTGNTSWMMRIENVVGVQSESGKLDDIVSLAAAMEVDSFKTSVGHYFEPKVDELNRPRFLSVISDELSRERQNTRSSSDSPKTISQDGSSDSPSTLPRRRFSTGSLDFPGAFWFSLPSPDQTTEKGEQTLENSLGQKWHFEKPSLGLSPMSSLKRNGSFNAPSDLNEQPTMSVKENSRSQFKRMNDEGTFSQENNRKDLSPGCVENTSHPKPKNALTRSKSSPFKVEKSHQLGQSLTNQQKIQMTEKQEQESKDVDSRESKRMVNIEQSKIVKPTTSSNARDISASTQHGDTEASHGVPREAKETRGRDAAKTESHKSGAQSIRDKLTSFSAYRPRGQTVSSYPVARKLQDEKDGREKFLTTEKLLKSSLNPYFVFLQFFYSPFIRNGDGDRPLLLGQGEVIDRSIKMLDRISPYDHHKIGILYVGPEQESSEAAILSNQFGSSRYIQFLGGLGSLISLPDCSPTEVYTGGLDRNGADGKFAYSWRDDITQVIFHVATLMPSKDTDPACYSKKLHVGNNFVTIVYNDSRKSYKFGTIKGQFNFAEILVKPLDYSSNLVTVRVKEDLKDVVTNTGPYIISDANLPILVRQLSIHANMATVIHHSRKKPSDAYGCNWLERLKQIKRIRGKAVIENQGPTAQATSAKPATPSKSNDDFNSDFTDYT